MKKLFAVLCIAGMVCSMTLVAAAADKASSMTGYITDEKCSTMGDASVQNHDCAAKCIAGGSKAVFINDKDKSVTEIANPDSIKGHEGHHVTISATSANNALTVKSVKMAGGASKGAAKGKS
jgi:hypothetical protein